MSNCTSRPKWRGVKMQLPIRRVDRGATPLLGPSAASGFRVWPVADGVGAALALPDPPKTLGERWAAAPARKQAFFELYSLRRFDPSSSPSATTIQNARYSGPCLSSISGHLGSHDAYAISLRHAGKVQPSRDQSQIRMPEAWHRPCPETISVSAQRPQRAWPKYREARNGQSKEPALRAPLRAQALHIRHGRESN